MPLIGIKTNPTNAETTFMTTAIIADFFHEAFPKNLTAKNSTTSPNTIIYQQYICESMYREGQTTLAEAINGTERNSKNNNFFILDVGSK